MNEPRVPIPEPDISASPEAGVRVVGYRGGRAFTVTVLPDAAPPPGRSQRTRYRMADVGRGSDLAARGESPGRPR